MTTSEEEKKLREKNGSGETPESKVTEKTDGTKSDLSENLSGNENTLRKAKIKEKEFAEKFKKKPNKELSQEEVVAVFQESESYKDMSYAEILDIVQNGVKKGNGKYDKTLQNKDLYTRLQDNVSKEPAKKEEDKEAEIEKKKKELNDQKPEKKEKDKDDGKKPNEKSDDKPEEKIDDKPKEKIVEAPVVEEGTAEVDPKAKEDDKKPEEKKEKKEKK